MLSTILATETHLPDINRSAGEFASMAIWGKPGHLERFCSVTVLRDDVPIAAIIMHNYHPAEGVIEITAAGFGPWQSRRVINEVFGLCFGELACQLIVMRVAADDARTIRNSRKLGFTGYLIPRLRGRDKAEWIFTLTDDAWHANRLRRP